LNRNSVAREVAAFVFYLLLAIVVTWPLAIRLSTGVSDPGDPLLNAWILNWDCYAFTHQPLHLFAAPIFSPAHLPLAYSENMVGIAILIFPFYLLGANAIALHSIAVILGFAMSGYGAYVLARMVSRSVPASLLAGIFHAYLSFRISHLSHVQIIWGGWLPLILAALIALHRNPSRRNAFLFAAAFVMNGLTNIYWLMFSSAAVGMTIWMYAIADGGFDRVYRRRLLFAMIGAGIVLLPFLAPYAIVSNEYHMQRNIGDALSGSASWSDWLVPAPNNALWGSIVDPALPRAERHLFPGLLPLLLLAAAIFWSAVAEPPLSKAVAPPPHSKKIDVAIVILAIFAYLGLVAPGIRWGFGKVTLLAWSGADIPLMLMLILIIVRFTRAIPQALGGGNLRSRLEQSRFSIDAWAAMVWIVVGFVGAFGLNGFFSEFLFRRTVLFRSVRAMARFASVSYAGLAVWMALGVVALLTVIRRPTLRAVTIALLFVAQLIDVSPRLMWQYVYAPPTEAQLWLRDHRDAIGGSTLELPMNNWGTPFLYLIGATVHHSPIMNGTSGFEPPLHRKLRESDEKFIFDDAFLDALEHNGCALILVHPDWTGPQGPPAARWIEQNVARGRMSFVRRFDHGVLGDWLFAVTRNARVRGVASDPNLTRFFRGEATYNATTFGRMDRPRDGDEVEGPLLVTGWALSPHGIRSATVLLNAGRIRVPAVLTPREDITQTWPWYPQSPSPAFTARIPKPPRAGDATDVQVEIVDGRGVATRFHDAKVRWK